METFYALLAICAGNSPVNGEFPAQRPGTRSFDVFLDLRLNERLSKTYDSPVFNLVTAVPAVALKVAMPSANV